MPWILLAAFILVGGCATQTPDPLAGWKPLFGREYEQLDEAIRGDYQNYILTLTPKERQSPSVHFYGDGTGQHAVEIIIGLNGRWWRHILIYDKENNRIKAIKYATGYYAS